MWIAKCIHFIWYACVYSLCWLLRVSGLVARCCGCFAMRPRKTRVPTQRSPHKWYEAHGQEQDTVPLYWTGVWGGVKRVGASSSLESSGKSRRFHALLYPSVIEINPAHSAGIGLHTSLRSSNHHRHSSSHDHNLYSWLDNFHWL